MEKEKGNAKREDDKERKRNRKCAEIRKEFNVKGKQDLSKKKSGEKETDIEKGMGKRGT